MKIKVYSSSILVMLFGILAANAQPNVVQEATADHIYPEFREILKKAEEHSLSYEKLDISLLNAKYDRHIDLSNKLPSVNFSTGLGAFWSSYNDDNKVKFGPNDLSLSASYSLFSWGAKKAGHRKAEKEFARFLIDYESNMTSIARDLRIRFLQLILDKFSLKTLELEVAINQANIDQDTVRYEQGRLSSENYERSMNSRKSRILDLENLKRQVERGIEDFNVKVGVENALTLQQIPTTIPSVAAINDQLFAMARQSESKGYSDIPGIQRAQLALDISEEDIIQTRSRTKPRIGLSARANYDVEPSKGNERVLNLSSGLGFSWNIYSGGANTKRVLKSLNSRTIRIAEYRDRLRQTEVDMQRVMEDLAFNYQKLEIAESEYQLALQSYEKSKDEYDRGRISDLHFLNVELTRLYQERNIYSQRKNYMVSIADFLATLGRDPALEILTLPEDKDLTHITENY